MSFNCHTCTCMNGHYETISIMVYLIKVNFQALHWKVLAITKKEYLMILYWKICKQEKKNPQWWVKSEDFLRIRSMYGNV